MNAEILHQDIQTLLEFFSKNCYRASDSKNSETFYVSNRAKLCNISSHELRETRQSNFPMAIKQSRTRKASSECEFDIFFS